MPLITPRPYWATTDGTTCRLYLGDVLDVLRRLPAGSVHTVVTSPPYWGLRDYGTGEWEGGDADCDHNQNRRENDTESLTAQSQHGTARDSLAGRDTCRKCGARRVDQQLGSEKVPDCLGWARGMNCAEHDWENGCHVCRMVLVFRECRRVLRDDGTLWLNYGDSYSSKPAGTAGQPRSERGWSKKMNAFSDIQSNAKDAKMDTEKTSGLKSGNLVGIPWRVALALQADGWVLRQDIIWHKPAPMPESVRNRCTKAHEYVFLFAKRMGYFYDMEAIREEAEYDRRDESSDWTTKAKAGTNGTRGNVGTTSGANPESGRNKRSVWTIEDEQAIEQWLAENNPEILAEFLLQTGNKSDVWKITSQGYPGAHFATFPPKLIEPMILAGTSEKGACVKCGAPWRRVVEERKLTRERPNEYVKRTGEEGTGNSCPNSMAGVETVTVGWEPTCACFSNLLIEDRPTVPCTVLDPFVGSGTTAVVAFRCGRRSWGIDLSEEYLRSHAVPRITGTIAERPAFAGLIPGAIPKPVVAGRSLLRRATR